LRELSGDLDRVGVYGAGVKTSMGMVVLFVACAQHSPTQPASTGDAAIANDAPSDAFWPDAFVPQDAPTVYPCAPTATAGHQTISCPMGVTMDVEISAACAEGGCGVIWDMPGFTMTADVQDTHTRMRTLAPPLGYIVVQPTTTGLWGTGQYNDVIWDFELAVADRLHTDPNRLHIMGFSQGADLTYLMLCAHPDAIASIAPDSGNGCFGLGTGPSIIRPVLYVQGTADNIQAWSIFGPPVRDAILASSDYGSGTVFSAGSAYMATRWTTSSGMDFEFWQHDFTDGSFLGGHCLPVPLGSGAFRCDDPEFDYSNEVLRFFAAHPRGM
jgi:pimeloyl-ACP methyl ester carboxylesterase